MPPIYNANYQVTRPLFTSDNKLISVTGLRSFEVFKKDNVSSTEISFSTMVPASATITCMYYIDAISQTPGRLFLGTSEGHILQWISGSSLTVLHSFPSFSISAFSHHPTSIFAIAMNATDRVKKSGGSIIRIYRLSEVGPLFDLEIYSRRYSSPISAMQPLRLHPSGKPVPAEMKGCEAFCVLCKNSNMFMLFYVKDSEWHSKPLCFELSPKYKSHPVSMLSVMKSVLVVGFSNGVIALYLMNTEKQALLTTLHWHSSPVVAMEWQRASKSLFSGASEGVLCHWNSPLNPFLRTISDSSAAFNPKYARTTRPSTTLPGFGAAFKYISISPSGKMAVVTSDNSLRLLPTYSPLDPASSSLLLLHRNGPAFVQSDQSKLKEETGGASENYFGQKPAFSYPLQCNSKFPGTILIPSPEGIQVIQEKSSRCSHILGGMPTGIQRIPGIPSLLSYSASLALSPTEVVVVMKNNESSTLQLALWRQNENADWIFVSSAEERPCKITESHRLSVNQPSRIFLSGPLEGGDSFVLGLPDGQLSLWKVSAKAIQRQLILRQPRGNPMIAMELVISNTLALITACPKGISTWLSIYEIAPGLHLKSCTSIDPRFDSLNVIPEKALVLASRAHGLISLYKIPEITPVWSLRLKEVQGALLLASNRDGLAVGLPGGPLFFWRANDTRGSSTESNWGSPGSCMLLASNKIPKDTVSLVLSSSIEESNPIPSVVLQRVSGELVTIPEVCHVNGPCGGEEAYDKVAAASAAVSPRQSKRTMVLMAGRGPSTLIDRISEFPSHTLPSPLNLMEGIMHGIGLHKPLV
ncbi:hypothetical protein MDAP_000349 [Mitosporidium daphniae]|uniref:Uncharacterized protein n=1 Tax=Mitosporidium daphniae TaxID=1485682 RepID=A0A098VNV9_9MICR|nr:uncharacterized protein DI09_58p50 [Mitosporidium daphniae]KGG50733.1 hypothetical protein DI09_58p50 [Mitosporidium daphniae]|eukprot:XP_013237174.1 uncharacterized protein DI09_58p50 [Mitosporidium daphniae]